MIERLQVVRTEGTVPYENLALEAHLLDVVRPGQCILYLWQNASTVVIGRNQSALAEVRVAELEADGGRLARRLSGGGAVYHDLGNLNFTFVARRDDYDEARQTQVIMRAVRGLGVPVRRTGRNDLVAGDEGGKFSGHAYYRSHGACCHHGTLMVRVDVDALGRYLRPAPDKLASKGVASVRSRVVNLADLAPGLTVEDVARALREALGAEHGLPVETLREEDLDAGAVEALAAHLRSREWLFRDDRDLDAAVSGRFPWGGVTVRYALDGGAVGECLVVSDGLDPDYLESVPRLLSGCPFTADAVGRRLADAAQDDAQRAVARDVTSLLFP